MCQIFGVKHNRQAKNELRVLFLELTLQRLHFILCVSKLKTM